MKKNYNSGSSFIRVFKSKWWILSFTLVLGLIFLGLSFVNTGPYVVSSTPLNGAQNVSINMASIAANSLYIPEVLGFKGGVNNATVTSETVKLLKVSGDSMVEVQGIVQGTGGGDAISFSPSYALEPNTIYKFVVTAGVKSHSGANFTPYESTFTTGSAREANENIGIGFTKVPIPGTQHKKYTTLTFGPDGKFYALRLDGIIERYTVQDDGMLSEPFIIKTLIDKYGERSAVGLTFDYRATAKNPMVWVSHCSAGIGLAPEFDGKISRLSGWSLEKEQLVITRLPRSNNDHLVNSLVFGPDSALYFSQGSNSSLGDYDSFWQRKESLLSAAVLRLDLKKLSGLKAPLDVYTTANQKLINSAPGESMRMSDGSYNPYGSSAPLTIYASGVRNAYDLVWHSNGQLYAPANGSAAGGNSPASVAGTRRPDGTFYKEPEIPATSGMQPQQNRILKKLVKLINAFVPEQNTPVQNDWLFRINPLKPVGYFGHPNPLRGEYVVNRGYIDNPKYPENIRPDPNYRGAAFNFEYNKSPNGAIEYKSNAFNGLLKGRILVCRFSGGSDIIILEPGALQKVPGINSATSNDKIYDIVRSYTGAGTSGIAGMAGFANPLDIVEDTRTGNLYVSEFNRYDIANRVSQITLLRVKNTPASERIATASR